MPCASLSVPTMGKKGENNRHRQETVSLTLKRYSSLSDQITKLESCHRLSKTATRGAIKKTYFSISR